MKFIHAADIHLDRPLTGLSPYSDAPVEMLRNATREAFTNLVSEAVEQQVDFMVIAGDLYDGTWKDHNTGIFFCAEMGRLRIQASTDAVSWLCEALNRGNQLNFGRLLWGEASEYPQEIPLREGAKAGDLFHLRITQDAE